MFQVPQDRLEEPARRDLVEAQGRGEARESLALRVQLGLREGPGRQE